MYALYQVSIRQATISLSFLLAHTSRCKPWESLWGSLATTPLGDFHHRLTACPSYQKNPGSLTAPGQSYAWTLCYYIFAVLSLDSATLHLGRGIRPIGLSPNILTRASSHRIFVLCLHCSLLSEYYSITEATRPDPTVRPPSRIAKVRPWLIAIGWISSIVISMLSPGMHISVPSGRVITPVTSVVLK